MMPSTFMRAPLARARMSVGVSEKAKSTAPAAYEETVVADPSPLTIVTSKPASFQKPPSRAAKNGACLPYGVKSSRKVIFSNGRLVCACARRMGARPLHVGARHASPRNEGDACVAPTMERIGED